MTGKLKRILCIDDEEDILAVAQITLETIGNLEIVTCNRGADAVRMAALPHPDLVLLDIMMPEMDGPATFQALQKNHATASIPVIFMTARVQPSEVRQYLSLGGAGVIAKPFDPVTLNNDIREIWDKL